MIDIIINYCQTSYVLIGLLFAIARILQFTGAGTIDASFEIKRLKLKLNHDVALVVMFSMSPVSLPVLLFNMMRGNR